MPMERCVYKSLRKALFEDIPWFFNIALLTFWVDTPKVYFTYYMLRLILCLFWQPEIYSGIDKCSLWGDREDKITPFENHLRHFDIHNNTNISLCLIYLNMVTWAIFISLKQHDLLLLQAFFFFYLHHCCPLLFNTKAFKSYNIFICLIFQGWVEASWLLIGQSWNIFIF